MLALFSSHSLQRGSSSSSGGGTQNGYASNYRGQGGAEHRDKERGHQGEASPYQSGLYDSWKTEWGGTPAYGYEHQQGYRPGGGGGGGSSEDSRHYRGGSYMTKGGRRPSYDDDF